MIYSTAERVGDRGRAMISRSKWFGLVASAALMPTAGVQAAEPESQQTAATAVTRDIGEMVLQNVPETPPETRRALQRYENGRSATFQDWMSDGSMLITTRFGQTPQIHRVSVPGGARTQVTFFEEPIGGNEWPSSVQVQPGSKDSFIYARDVGGSELYQGFYAGLATPEVRFTEPGTRNAANEDGRIFYIFSRDGRQVSWSRSVSGSGNYDIMVMTPGDIKTRRVALKGVGAMEPVAYSPDGKTLLINQVVSNSATRRYLLDVASGNLTELNAGAGQVLYQGGQFTSDGKHIVMISDEGSEVKRLVSFDLVSGRQTVLTDKGLKWEIEAFDLSPDGKTMSYAINEDGITRVVLAEVDGHLFAAQPSIPQGALRALKFSPDGRRLAIGLTSPRSPGDVWAWNLGSRSLERWTKSENGGLDTDRMIEPSLVHYRSFDGKSIPAFLYRPTAGRGRVPVILYIHGGPESQERPVYNANFQYWLNELGAAVLTPNIRGSTGYGKTWLNLDNGMQRSDAIKDIGSLIDWVKSQPALDADRIIVFGASYGGFMTLASLSNYGDRLAGGVDIVGPSNYVTFLTNTDGYRRDHRRAEYGDERVPSMRAYLEGIAPANNTAKMTKPLLVIQGANDPRVPRTEADQIVSRVRARGVPVWYILAKDEGHGFSKKNNLDAANEAITLFMQKVFSAPVGSSK
jgi:dipeptidyl aminopeptidase/acylaminoacyl peptidase